ncbi:PREDICTED: arylphorin subunit alpha-like [Polistes dominula]|uniref:Arylphorin subunit alpha-like n=1 Tax=Polistes dominula TaxID=743375 RepID=A0ABM1ICK8_POLDO|nr:PREDICTED: arylphorin subunit alpha-like [Polistes dominula]
MLLKEVLFLVLAALCLSNAVSIKSHTADMDFIHKQKKIYELLFYVQQNVLTDTEFYNVGRNYEIENNVDMYTDKNIVKEFVYYYKHGMLSRDAVFSPFHEEQRNEMILLFKLFYYAKDFQTFYKTAAWARLNLNPEVFSYAFYVAIFYRPDCKYIYPMPPYESNPSYFFDSSVIQEAHRIKMTHGLTPTGNTDHTDTYIIYNNYTDRSYYDEDYKLDYFMEDFGLNSYYYYFRQIFPFWLNSKEYNIPQEFRGIFYLYIHQQLIARYYLERLSNGLGEIEDFNFQKAFYPGFYSSIMFRNGVVMPQRKSYYNIPYYKNYYLKDIDILEYRIINAIDSGLVMDHSGKFVNIYTPEGLNILGNLIEGNSDTCNSRYYGMYESLVRNVFGYDFDYANKNKFVPSAMQLYSTNMRDPAFYRLFNKISNFVYRYKENLPVYSQNELNFPGVKIESVNMDKLWTYFDYCDATINNAVFFDSFKEGLSLRIKARRYCLNYKPFTYHLGVNSDKDTKAMVKIFLGPAFDSMGEDLSYLRKYYKYFVELDQFIVTLKPGMNNIERKSSESVYTMPDMMSSDSFYKKLQKAASGGEPFTYYEKLYAFPERLTLPKGTPEGMKFKLFFYLTPYDESKVVKIDLPIFGKLYYDGKPCGFPLDRPMYTYKFFTPNMYFKDVYIYNTKDAEKFSHY